MIKGFSRLFLTLLFVNSAWSQNIKAQIEVYKLRGSLAPLTREAVEGQNSIKLASLSLSTKSGQRAASETSKEIAYITAINDGVPEVEIRNVGLSFEFEPVIGPDGYTVDMNFLLSYTSAKKTADWRLIPVGNQNIEDPGFVTRKMNTSTQIHAKNEWKLLGVLSNEGNEEDAEYTYPVFIQVTLETQ